MLSRRILHLIVLFNAFSIQADIGYLNGSAQTVLGAFKVKIDDRQAYTGLRKLTEELQFVVVCGKM